MQLSRFSLILSVISGLCLNGSFCQAAATAPVRNGGHGPGAPARLSLLPAGLAQAIAQTVAPAGRFYALRQELAAPDGAAMDQYGYSVQLSSDGRTALIGAPGQNGGQGAAYVFTAQAAAWTEQQKLKSPDGAASDSFGQSVALSSDGRTALIGAPGQNGGQGAAYVFTGQAGAWTEQKELVATDGAAGDGFGFSVALGNRGQTALIGATGTNAQGAAYVFTKQATGWTEQKELTAPDGAANDYFGYSTALSSDGSTALIGATGTNGQGAAYVFTGHATAWTEQQELTAPDLAFNDEFGYSVQLSSGGQTALIGTPNKNGKGAAYVFARQTTAWTEQQELAAIDGVVGDGFGNAVTLTGDGYTAMIGAPYREGGHGAAYVFNKQTTAWTGPQELTAPDGAFDDYYGYSVALSSDGSAAMVGALGKNSYKGAVYAFTESSKPLK